MTECHRSANRTYNTAFPGSILGETKLFPKGIFACSFEKGVAYTTSIPQKIYRLLQDIN